MEHEKMDPEIKEKWLWALREGPYEQGSQFLKKHGRYCCLGVLCDIVAPELWLGVEAPNGVDNHEHGFAQMPSGEVLEVAGVPYPVAYNLAALNDQGLTFHEIADVIEEDL